MQSAFLYQKQIALVVNKVTSKIEKAGIIFVRTRKCRYKCRYMLNKCRESNIIELHILVLEKGYIYESIYRV